MNALIAVEFAAGFHCGFVSVHDGHCPAPTLPLPLKRSLLPHLNAAGKPTRDVLEEAQNPWKGPRRSMPMASNPAGPLRPRPPPPWHTP